MGRNSGGVNKGANSTKGFNSTQKSFVKNYVANGSGTKAKAIKLAKKFKNSVNANGTIDLPF